MFAGGKARRTDPILEVGDPTLGPGVPREDAPTHPAVAGAAQGPGPGVPGKRTDLMWRPGRLAGV